MNFLVLEARNQDTQFLDQDISRSLATYGGHQITSLDPCAVYEAHGAHGLEAAIERAVAENRIEVFVCCAFGVWLELDPRFVYERLKDCYRVYIVGDDEAHFDQFDRYNAQAYDLVLSANPLVERYHQYQIGAEYYPSVYPSAVFHPSEENSQKTTDLSFVGALQGKAGRLAAIEKLQQSGLKVVLHGPGTPLGQISAEAAISLYRRSRINLNFTGTARSPLAPQDSIVDRIRQVKGRCSKIALCGAFVLSERAPGLERQFDIGKEIDVFDTPEELVDKARYYLAHEGIREAMAARAHARAVEQYDETKYWKRTAARLEAAAREARARQRQRLPLLIDKDFWSRFGACRFKYLAIFFFGGQFRLFVEELRLLLRTGRLHLHSAFWFAATGIHLARQHSKGAAALAALARPFRRASRGSK